MTIEELLRIVSAGYGDDLVQHIGKFAPAYREFMAETILVTTHDDQDVSYRIRGHLFRKFGMHAWPNILPHLKSRLPNLWTRSYYVGTAGNVSATTIRKCIDAQHRRGAKQ